MKSRPVIKVSVLTVILLSATLSLYSLDFGVYLDNSTSLTLSAAANQPATSFLQADKASLWFQSELGEYFDFRIQGSYSYSSDNMPYLFDIDRLTLTGRFPITKEERRGAPGVVLPAIFSFSMGRFPFKDFSGYVLNHNLDGLKLSFGYPDFNTDIRFGYSGLLLKPTSSIYLSKEDVLDTERSNVILASPRIIGMFTVNIPSLFRQSISLSVLFQEDLRNLFSSTLVKEGDQSFNPQDGGLVDTQYIGLGSTGSIVPSLYYGTFAYLGTGRMLSYLADSGSATGYSYQYTGILSYMAGLRLRYFLSNFLDSYALVETLIASGDATDNSIYEGNTDAVSEAFNPISNTGVAVVFSPVLKNMVSFKGEFSLKPLSVTGIYYLKDFQTQLRGYVFLRPTAGPISESGLSPSSNSLYLGSEGDIIINWRPFSDLGISLNYGIFIPNNGQGGAFTETERALEQKLLFKLSLSF